MTRVLRRLAAEDPITPRHMRMTPRHMRVEAPSQRPPSLESKKGKTQRIAQAQLLSSLAAALNTSPSPTPDPSKENRRSDDAGGAGAARRGGSGDEGVHRGGISVQKDTPVSGKCLSSLSPPRSSLWELYPPEQRDGVQGAFVSFRFS